MLFLYVGNWAEARAVLEQEVLRATRSWSPWAVGNALFLECQLGNLKEAESLGQHLLEISERVSLNIPATGLPATAEAARIMGNSRWLRAQREMGRRNLGVFSDLVSCWIRVTLGLIAAQEQDAAEAAEQYAHLDQFIGSGLDTVNYRHLGIIAQAAGLEERAVAHFEDALAFTRKAGYRAELAWTCCDYADLLRARNGPGDGERAAALLEEGLVIARDLGMRPLMERILSRRQFLKA
jgi:tetratricopeptide (TPR) repeat protein